ncbi:mechanosensitive ion channel family protein [Methanotorris igneus]|uniref:MscS Mechanosensitive ion channel n=1 Tax=Methanotorris igneus (strain DSM 5666 / JCM 11834 / Kol 5) TaxID=880724 RepID=F6BCJ6_METIK|nr:mechanosensitive ion channel domain-containing protein [Methanotorris igneus]AEF96207.1 MscS Mechanosensitive ion channel [Methanotorris igneus Kol 5]
MRKIQVFRIKFITKVIILLGILYYLGCKLNFYQYLLKLGDYINQIIILTALILGTLIFLDITLELLRKYFEKVDIREYPIVASVVKYATWFGVILIAISVVYKDVGSLVMSLGLVGAALTLALQKPIMNFVGWLTIVFTHPFKINDRIYIKGIGGGDVYKIGTMYVSLREVDGEPTGRSLNIPNSYILTNPVINFSKGSPYVWDSVKVTITYESNWRKAEELILEACDEIVGEEMRRLAEIWKNKPRIFAKSKIYDKPVIRMRFLDSGIEIKVRYLVNVFEWAAIKTKIVKNILSKLEEVNDVEIAYPHMEVIHRQKSDIVDNPFFKGKKEK